MQLKKGVVPTARDGGNAGIIVSIQIIIIWLLVDVVGLEVPREVAVAFGGILGYLGGRFLRY